MVDIETDINRQRERETERKRENKKREQKTWPKKMIIRKPDLPSHERCDNLARCQIYRTPKPNAAAASADYCCYHHHHNQFPFSKTAIIYEERKGERESRRQ